MYDVCEGGRQLDNTCNAELQDLIREKASLKSLNPKKYDDCGIVERTDVELSLIHI